MFALREQHHRDASEIICTVPIETSYVIPYNVQYMQTCKQLKINFSQIDEWTKDMYENSQCPSKRRENIFQEPKFRDYSCLSP